MKLGDVIESSVWLTGDEPEEMRKRYENDVSEAIDYFCFEKSFIAGPVSFDEKHPMDDVIEVPDHIKGSRVRLLVASATVVEKAVETSRGSFVANLEMKDLKKLRTIIRRHRDLTDIDCDRIIEEIGPDAALDTLRELH